MNVLFLDDDDRRTKKFRPYVPSAITVETANECIKALGRNDWDVVSLDHDLGGEIYVSTTEYNTGTTVAKWICENKPNIKEIIIHSFNSSAARGMVSMLARHNYQVIYIPFGSEHYFGYVNSCIQ